MFKRSLQAALETYRKVNFSGKPSLSRMVDHMPMKAYVRVLKEEDRMEIKLRYIDPNLGLDRWFSFNRSLDDKVQQLKERVVANIDKACLKYRKKKKNANNEELFKLEVQLKNNNEILDYEVACRQLLQLDSVEIAINSQTFQLDIDPPLVRTLKLPTSNMAGFLIYPSKLEIENCDVNECDLRWYKSPNSLAKAPEAEADTWSFIGSGFYYTASNQDIGCWLKLQFIPKSGAREGLSETIVSPRVVEAGPGHCPFETRHNFTKECVDNSGIRVVTYNILADLYCDSDYTRTVLHPYCPPYALAIDYRKQLIVKELIGYNADLICLQEVDSKIFDAVLEPIFSSLGFNAIFNKKGGQVSEGVATFFNTTKFKFIQSFNYILAEELPSNPSLVDLWQVMQKNENLSKRVLDRSTSCQVLVLESCHNGRRIVVANTHLYFHPDADHIRLLQAATGLRLAQDIRNREQTQGKDVALIFCGDFNSTPGSGVFELMTLQNIDDRNVAWSSKPDEAIEGLSLFNPVAMETACGTPPFTNYTAGFNDCLDYIFFEKEKYSVEQVVPLPSLEEVTLHCALPSIVFPSDHVSLVADLKWK